ncbi:MAG: sugar ABC transporter permease [Treponema sp.]|jgi:raffinose/stachyose/melibiose transport system permease protein|nr:sugar ABC transporter permease [Treponema sp.]
MKLKSAEKDLSKYVFILPGFCLFCFAIFIPFLSGINIAFTDWNGIDRSYHYVGLKNFLTIFADQRMILPVRNSLLFGLLGTVGGTVFSLGMALLVDYKSNRISNLSRTVFFLPVCFSSILTAFIWKFLYKEVFSSLFGIKSFLGNPVAVIPAITLMELWNTAGINMLIYLAGLKNIPQEFYDAAKVDGASSFKSFVHITLPLLTPSFTVCITLSITSWLREFATTLAATGGGPGGTSRTLAIYIFENLFEYNKAGYGQAVAILFSLFCIVLGISVSNFFRKREIEL